MARRRLNTASPAMAGISEADAAERRSYEARDAIRTLQRAEEIKADRGLMRDVKREAVSQQKALAKVTGRQPKKR